MDIKLCIAICIFTSICLIFDIIILEKIKKEKKDKKNSLEK